MTHQIDPEEIQTDSYKPKKNSKIVNVLILLYTVGVIAFIIFHVVFMNWIENKNAELDAIQAANTLIIEARTIEEKVVDLKNEVRNKIMNRESAGIVVEAGDLFPTFDPSRSNMDSCRRVGGKMNLDCLSFGPLQFKLSTIIYYEKEINNVDVTEMEALVIAHDLERSSKLFDDIVYNVEGGIWNWSAALIDPGYYNTVIPIIRNLIN